MRGDVDDNGVVDMNDALHTLEWMLLGRKEISCLDSADATDNGAVELNDPIHVLKFLFLGSDAPAAPFPGCSLDRTGDLVGCESYRSCPITSLEDL